MMTVVSYSIDKANFVVCNCELVLNVMNRMYFKFSVIGLLRKELCEGKHFTKGSKMNSILPRIILFCSGEGG